MLSDISHLGFILIICHKKIDISLYSCILNTSTNKQHRNKAMNTYNETINRYTISRHDELPQGHKDEMIKLGINPDTRWSLIYSFENEADALEALAQEQADAATWETFKMTDNGQAQTIQRSII